jgi:hypothetical protein
VLMPPAPAMLATAHAPARRTSLAMASVAHVSGGSQQACWSPPAVAGAGCAWLSRGDLMHSCSITFRAITHMPTHVCFQAWSIAAPTTEAAAGMQRAPTCLRATHVPANRDSQALATFAHVSGRSLHACCSRLAVAVLLALGKQGGGGRGLLHFCTQTAPACTSRSPRPHVVCLQPWTRAPSTTEAAVLMPPAPLLMAPAHVPVRRASLATDLLAQASGGSMRAC